MIRTALRLSTVAALTGFGREPWPTLVRDQVHDSRKDAIDDLVAETRMPVLIVRTDEDRRIRRDPRSGQPSAVTLARSIALRIEASVMTAVRDPRTNEVMVAWPASDSGMEAMLDLLEYQVEAALAGNSPTAMWWRGLWGVDQVDSEPLWTTPADGKVRLAVREMTWQVRAPADCLPPALREDQVDLGSDGEPILANALPGLLAEILDRIEADGDGDLKTSARQIRAQLEARDLPKPSVHPTLTSVIMRIPEVSPPSGEDPLTQFEAELLKAI